jgi:uncharacterized repeat protein (TIGR03803 family)
MLALHPEAGMQRNGFWIILSILTAVLAMVTLVTPAWAQSEQALYAFQGGPNDGANPFGRPILDKAGNIYGTTLAGGATYWAGSVYQLTPSSSGWTETMVYSFGGTGDGAQPEAGLVMDKTGNLYGTTVSGGGSNDGTVFELTPSGSGWTEQIIHSFTGADGVAPYLGHLTFDRAGNLYGTTKTGGKHNAGTVFKLVHAKSGWKEKTLYAFAGGNDANWANESLVFDKAGNLYGASYQGGGNGCGGLGCGTVFKLTRTKPGWKEKVLYAFTGGKDGGQPYESVILDKAGNLYGTTFAGGDANGDGVVFELTHSKGTWKEKVLYAFTGGNDGANPYVNVIFGKGGVLFGATDQAGANKNGVLFKLTPSKGTWKQTVLYAFTGGTDGGLPLSGLTFDEAGNIYGVTVQGGDNSGCGGYGCGTVYEFTP